MSALLLAFAAVTPTAPSSAAQKTATSSIPIDATTTLEMHTTANCVKAENQCYFDTAANLRGADGAYLPFPDDLYARQNTTLRSTNRLVYLDSDFNAPNTRMMKSIGPVEFPTVYFGGGPPEKFMVHGNTRTVDWSHRAAQDRRRLHRVRVHPGGLRRRQPDHPDVLRPDHLRLNGSTSCRVVRRAPVARGTAVGRAA